MLASVVLVPAVVHAGTIEYVGSSTVGKFVTDASKVYTNAQFKLNTKPESSGGEQCAARKSCDMGGVARAVNKKFLDHGVVATLVGKDAIAAVVNADNPVSGLTAEQLKGIFIGKIKNWSEVGGPALAIEPYIVKKGSATRKVFRKVILGNGDYVGTKVVTPDAKIVTTVARKKGAIGQISFAFLSGKTGVKPLDIDGQKATVENASYPITRPLHIVTNGNPSGDVAAFLDWALSPEGQKVVKQRFVGVD
ncbi:MAG: phosphate ABC transporter substrate-binding protein [Candidatus Sedimenticola sp. (ex Thyasira tokunagai)]